MVDLEEKIESKAPCVTFTVKLEYGTIALAQKILEKESSLLLNHGYEFCMVMQSRDTYVFLFTLKRRNHER